LPLPNIKVELLPFYVIAPLLYFVFHFYVLMMLLLLARTAAPFEEQLKKALPGEGGQERYRARVENALFLQLLIGMREERAGFNSLLLAAIALITIVLAPLATLILMQMMFLPYHSFGITWWHRALVLADVGLVLIMWRRFFYTSGIDDSLLFLRGRPKVSKPLAFAASLGLGCVVFWLSLSEGRWAGEPRILQTNVREYRSDFFSTRSGVVFGLFPDRLILRDETIVGDDQLEKTKKESASRGGDFVPTIKLDDRDLQAADLSGADFRGVSLSGARMVGAELEGTRLDGADLEWAKLWDANLSGVRLQGANLHGVLVQRANLSGVRLQGADLGEQDLEGTNLEDAQLQGADLHKALLTATDLRRAQLQGADLHEALLQGTDLRRAQLQGANLSNAYLRGADLREAQLQGADLSKAQFLGTDLSNAQWQGADLSDADLGDSTFDGTFVFRTNIAGANLSTSSIRPVRADQAKVGDKRNVESLNPTDVDAWIAAATQFASASAKVRIAARFARLGPDFRETDQEATWQGMQEASIGLDPDGAQHRRRLATTLGDLACGYNGAPPDVAQQLIWWGYPSLGMGDPKAARLAQLGDQLDVVRTRMKEGRKNPEKCPGVAGFDGNDWRMLEAIKPAQSALNWTLEKP